MSEPTDGQTEENKEEEVGQNDGTGMMTGGSWADAFTGGRRRRSPRRKSRRKSRRKRSKSRRKPRRKPRRKSRRKSRKKPRRKRKSRK